MKPLPQSYDIDFISGFYEFEKNKMNEPQVYFYRPDGVPRGTAVCTTNEEYDYITSHYK